MTRRILRSRRPARSASGLVKGWRLRRFAGRALVAVLALFLLITASSIVGNRVTRPAWRSDPSAGRFVEVGSTSVHLRTWGSGGSPVVLLPGFAESAEAFALAAPRIAAAGHTVYAIDLPGYGYTRGGDVDDLRSQVELVSGVIARERLDRPVVLGHSMGAAVAGGLALWHPDQARGVIFADGDAQDLAIPASGIARLLARSPYVISLYRIATRWTWLDQRVLASTCGSACTAFDGEEGRRRAAARLAPLRQGEIEKQFLGRLGGGGGILHLSESQMRAIATPRAIIWGAEDERSGGSLPDTRERLGHPAERIIPGAAHDVMAGNPAAFADAVISLSAAFG